MNNIFQSFGSPHNLDQNGVVMFYFDNVSQHARDLLNEDESSFDTIHHAIQRGITPENFEHWYKVNTGRY